MNWYLTVIKKYATFSGRARRKEYWMFFLFNIIFSIAAIVLDNVLGIAIGSVGYGPIYILYVLAVLLPSLAVSVRRLHDVGKKWMVFVYNTDTYYWSNTIIDKNMFRWNSW